MDRKPDDAETKQIRGAGVGGFQYDSLHIVSANAGDSRAIFARLLSPAQAAAILLPLQNHYEQYKYYLEVGRRFFPYRLITHPRSGGTCSVVASTKLSRSLGDWEVFRFYQM